MSIKSSLRKYLEKQDITIDEDNASISSMLRKYVSALGGTPEAGDSTDELMQKIAESDAGSSSGIVAVECDLYMEWDDPMGRGYLTITVPSDYKSMTPVAVGAYHVPANYEDCFTPNLKIIDNQIVFCHDKGATNDAVFAYDSSTGVYSYKQDPGYIIDQEIVDAWMSATGGKLTLFFDTSIEAEGA